jgi:hypothetical protein
MLGRGVAALAAIASLALAGCGDDEPKGSNSGLASAPPGVAEGCGEAADVATVPVLCPTRWPDAARPGGPRLHLWGGRTAYLLEAQAGFGGRSPVFHVLFGGQEKPFPRGFEGGGRQLKLTTERETTPILAGGEPTGRYFVVSLPTRVVGDTRVHGRGAAILKAPPYPKGDIHGGHYIVMWNEGGHGYLVSTHSETSRRAATRVAIQIARSSQPATP